MTNVPVVVVVCPSGAYLLYWVFHLKIKYPKLFLDPYYAFVYSRSRKIETRKKK